MSLITDPGIWIALATLTFLEIVLGVDNIIFISILSGKLRADQRPRARRLGLLGAMVTRVLLLFSLASIIKLTAPLFTVLGHPVSGRDLIARTASRSYGRRTITGRAIRTSTKPLRPPITPSKQTGTSVSHGCEKQSLNSASAGFARPNALCRTCWMLL